MALPVNLTDNTLSPFIKGNRFAVVDFYSEDCKPCKTFSHVVNFLAEEYAGLICFGKIDKDKNPSSTQRYMIVKVPATLVFYRGRLIERFIGAWKLPNLEVRLNRILHSPIQVKNV